jgi:hypothetical protein
MLECPNQKATPLKDALFETFNQVPVKASIPRFVKKSIGMLRRDANEIRE